MANYTDAELAAAGQALAQGIRGLTDRITQLEAKPTVDQMQQDWSDGRRLARQKGYGDEDLARLENMMQARGVQNHADAMRIDPTPPSGRGWFLRGLPEDERQALFGGDDDGFLARALGRIRSGD